jgi:hypothetical protein
MRMTDLFEYRRGDKPMGDVIPFVKSDRQIEHVDSTTIVEKLEMTDEMKAEFEALGYTFEEQA